LIGHNDEWKTVAPETDGLEELKQTKKEKKKELRALKRKAVADGAVLQSSPKRSHVTPSVASTVPSPVPSPVKILVNNNQENLDPQNPPPRLRVRPAPNNDDEQEPKKAKYVGLSSTVEDRTEKAAELERQARNDKKRSVGVPATTLGQQGDKTGMQAMQTAFEATARFSDTIHCPGRLQGQPRRGTFLVDVNEVEENAAHGGNLKSGEIRRSKTLVTIVGPTDMLDLSWLMQQMILSVKHKNGHPGHNYESFLITRDRDTALVATSVARWKAGNKTSRQQPAKKHRAGDVIIAEQHQRHSERNL
jgi:hypothetical protein